MISAGAIQLKEDISGHTTTGYDIAITVSDAKNTVGPKILTIIVKGKHIIYKYTNDVHFRGSPNLNSILIASLATFELLKQESVCVISK